MTDRLDTTWNDLTGSRTVVKRFKTRKGAQNLADRQNSGLKGEVHSYRGIKHSCFVTVVEDGGEFAAVWVNAPFVTPTVPARFTVVSDVDEVRESHHNTFENALQDVHRLLTSHPEAEVVVLDEQGAPVYDIAKHDSCTRHLIAFSKEINCPQCSAERPCEGCGAAASEPCDPFCTGQAAAKERVVYGVDTPKAPVTVYVATAEVRGYTVTAAGHDRAEAVQTLHQEIKRSPNGRAVLALYADRAEWEDEVNVHTLTTGKAAWL